MSSPSCAADRKRKHSAKTIKDLFTTQQKPNVATQAPLSPSNKRTKLDTDPLAEETETTRTPPITPTLDSRNMYNFPSKKGNVDVVDLSSSPPGSSSAKASDSRNGVRRIAANMHSNAGPKKLIVKNFKPTRKADPKVFLEQTWDKVNKALETIFLGDQINFSLEEMYRGVENLCRQGMAKEAKERLVVKCRAYIRGTLRAKPLETVGRKNVDVLRATLQAWATWNEQMVSRRLNVV
jgi:cullin 4